jgi:hypothetical protein
MSAADAIAARSIAAWSVESAAAGRRKREPMHGTRRVRKVVRIIAIGSGRTRSGGVQ